MSRWFGNRKVNTKIAAVSILALVASAVGFVAIQKLASMDQAAARIDSEALTSVQTVDAIRLDVRQARIDMLNHILSQDAAKKATLEEAIKADDQAVADSFSAYEKTDMTGR